MAESIRSAKGTTMSGNASTGLTEEERAAMKERAKELKAEARANKNQAQGESDVLAAIAWIKRADHQLLRFRRADTGDLLDRHGRTVGFDAQRVDHAWVGAAGTNAC